MQGLNVWVISIGELVPVRTLKAGFSSRLPLLTHLENIKLQADALNPTYIKAFLDTVILYYTTTTPLFRSTPSLLLRYVLPHDNKDPSSSGENYVPEFSVMFWGAFLFQSLLWQRCAEVHVE